MQQGHPTRLLGAVRAAASASYPGSSRGSCLQAHCATLRFWQLQPHRAAVSRLYPLGNVLFQHRYKETDLVLTDNTGKELGIACCEPFPAQGASAPHGLCSTRDGLFSLPRNYTASPVCTPWDAGRPQQPKAMSRVHLPFAQSHQEGCSQTDPHRSIVQSEWDKDGLGFIQHSHTTHGVPQPRQ